MIDIIINNNDSLEMLYKTLFSISYQDISSLVKVYTNCIDKALKNEFSSIININIFDELEACFKKSSNPYVIFINAGDTFCDSGILKYMFLNIFNTNIDYAYRDSNNIMYSGIFKRSYLFKNNDFNIDNDNNKKLDFDIFIKKDNNIFNSNKCIDIIIPYYNSKKTIVKTLSSIALSNYSKYLKVTMIDDCSTEKYNLDYFKKFIDLKIVKMKKNSGPGVARQYGIDITSNPYIMFIDSDDVFINKDCFDNIFDYIKNNDVDIIINNVLYESDDYKLFNTHNNDTVLHGKCYRRDYLRKHNIRFSNTRRSEDNSFNNICMLFKPKYVILNDNVYMYHYRKGSITRSDDYHVDLNYALDFVNNLKYYCSYLNDNIDFKRVQKYLAKSFIWLWKIYNNELSNPLLNNYIKEISCLYIYYKDMKIDEFLDDNVEFKILDSNFETKYLNFIELIKNYHE